MSPVAETKKLTEVYFNRKHYPRIMVNEALVIRYAAAMRNGVVFPPIDVTPSGIILDGVHRYLATRLVAKESGVDTIQAHLHNLTSDEEIMRFAIDSNCQHGENLTVADLRHIVANHPTLEKVVAEISRFGFDLEDEEELDPVVEETAPAKTTQQANAPVDDENGIETDWETTGGDDEEESGLDEQPVVRSTASRQSTEATDSEETGSGESDAPRAPQTHGDLCPALSSLGMKGLMTMPAQRMLQKLSIPEQKLLISKLESNLDTILQLSGDTARAISEMIDECRQDGIDGEELVERILSFDALTPSVDSATCYDPWYTVRLRIGQIRKQIEDENCTVEERKEILDWSIAQFTAVLIEIGQTAHIKPHSFATFPDLVKTRSVEVEHGIM